MPKRAARSPFPDHHANDRRCQPRHLQQVRRDELGLAALLGADARKGARRVDQTDHRQPKLRRQPHVLQRFAIAFRVGAAIKAFLLFLERAPLLMADQHDAEVAEPGEAAADRPVVADGPVAVQLDEIIEYQIDVIHQERPILVARHLDGLPRRQGAVNLLLEIDQLATNAADLLGDSALPAVERLQAGKHLFQLVDFLLEIGR